MRPYSTREARRANAKRADAVLARALGHVMYGRPLDVDQNLVDKFVFRLIDAGIDPAEFDAVIADGAPEKMAEE